MNRVAAIIGGGVIGGGWLARFLLNGWDVNVFDPDLEAERKIGEVLANARRALPMLYDVALPAEGKLTFCDRIEAAVSDAEWIQESVPERLDIKHMVFSEVEKYAPENAIIGSSTSGFKPSELQEGLSRPEAVIVTHPFNPVYLLPLIELVPSAVNDQAMIERAQGILTSLGLYPLHVRKEIDAHIADRFLEAVWREALWLIKDGIATTEEIDNAIRYGFGLRWGQMGLFETYRVAGGEAGMEHFIAQFGPCLKWPWTKLMDVPELTDELTKKIAGQSDAQSGHMTIRELEQLRDNNLVAMMRALKGQNAAAGALLNTHQANLAADHTHDFKEPLQTVNRVIPVDWVDYNGHMNESRYGQVFSDAADAVMVAIGADEAYIASGLSYFTVDIDIKFLLETHVGQAITVMSHVLMGEGKKLKLYHKMFSKDGTLLATGEQFLLHVSLETRRTCEPSAVVLANVEAAAAAHAKLLDPRT
ncbi:carnitine 3-dehydrogenase [Amylibacter sp. SFDW26]|uniref:carnitine 3-dehydrogenase n=1 Tax=Amylibacter sp. SFDW26 TaxID=2652722 RepID=UPI0012629D22|nr:carnitine 3-dehydrogenase [Amylibacter sp. SFDW26]KAB7616024.1 carnitine 3-dehydrogenase [Amylibacter sp. SFDW26]